MRLAANQCSVSSLVIGRDTPSFSLVDSLRSTPAHPQDFSTKKARGNFDMRNSLRKALIDTQWTLAPALASGDARRLRKAAQDCKKLHLACGPVIREGWINVDIDEREGAFRWDLRRKLPFDAGSIDVIYAEHFIEHITLEEAEALMRDCVRALSPVGVCRLSTPDLAFLVGEYQLGRLTEWADMGWRPKSPARMINEGMRLWGHHFLYDEAELHGMLYGAGFATVKNCKWRESDIPALACAESRPYHRELIVEATKA